MQPWLWRLFLGLISMISSLALAKVADPTPATDEPIVQITHSGDNRQALYMRNDEILFVSSNRTEHKDPQIYSRDLITGIEKRITYQRGDVLNGFWLGETNKIVYASSTDEDKETPEILKPYLARFPASIDTDFFFQLNIRPTEIYSSNLDGTQITRLSSHPGFDAFPAYDYNKRTLYFSRLANGHINIFSQTYGSADKAKQAVRTLGHDLGLQLSPQRDKFTWYRFSPDFKSSQIFVSDTGFKSPRLVTIDEGIQWSPSWHPEQKTILFSARKGKDKNYDIYEVDVESQCQRKITTLKGDEFYPAVSHDGKKVLFTATVTGSEQIHQMDYPAPFKCEIQ